jgi:polyisoprenoid-binding protein YceI
MRLAERVLGLALLLLCAGRGPVTAQTIVVRNGTITQGTLSFDGHATLGDFVGTTNSMSGQFSGDTLPRVTGWVEAPVNTLKTGNGRRDRDLNKSMETEKYPTMRFELASVTPGAPGGDTLGVTLHGSLKIHGVTRQVALPATLIIRPTELHLHSDFPLDLTDYQIGGLSKMLGMLRMNPHIVVHVDLTFDQH